ncbi:FeoC-like transcriptional regulator [Aliikangiella sp. IMCC44359]|uniref:FeoC-like transcriptional regulator n=1 Tax=Aliikangiella sp. IMCC44359 TaxID=3459125 RepID=UPI00403AF357
MLLKIKKLLSEREEMSLTDLARHFYVSEGVMESMLEQWLKKGKVSKRENSGSCSSSCGSCSEASDVKVYYRWKSVAEKPIFTSVK